MTQYKVEICGVNTSKLPLLKNEEKKVLFDRILEGDTKAREKYIYGNLRLVLIIYSLSRPNMPQILQGPGIIIFIMLPFFASKIKSQTKPSRAPSLQFITSLSLKSENLILFTSKSPTKEYILLFII